MVAPMARPKRMACSTAARFSTGSVPGSAMSTAEACVLGSAPKALAAAEKILLRVRSCAWVSMPTTISQAIVATSPRRHRSCAARCSYGRRVPSWRGASQRRLARHARMPVGRLLVAMGDAEELRFGKVIAGELQADRQAGVVEPTGHGKRRQSGERRRDGEDVIEVHLHRIIAFRADGERGGGGGGPEDDIALRERLHEIARDQAADLLRLEVIGVVVAVRKNVGADEDAPLHFCAEAFGSCA